MSDNSDKPQENKTDVTGHKVAAQDIAKNEAGNTILVLLVILSVIGFIPLIFKN